MPHPKSCPVPTALTTELLWCRLTKLQLQVLLQLVDFLGEFPQHGAQEGDLLVLLGHCHLHLMEAIVRLLQELLQTLELARLQVGLISVLVSYERAPEGKADAGWSRAHMEIPCSAGSSVELQGLCGSPAALLLLSAAGILWFMILQRVDLILEVLSNFNDSMILLGQATCRTREAKRLPFFQPGHWPQTGLSVWAVARKSKSWAGDRVWCQFAVFTRSHKNQWKKLQLTSADADLGLQHGTESGLLFQDLPCSASAKTWLRIMKSQNC